MDLLLDNLEKVNFSWTNFLGPIWRGQEHGRNKMHFHNMWKELSDYKKQYEEYFIKKEIDLDDFIDKLSVLMVENSEIYDTIYVILRKK